MKKFISIALVASMVASMGVTAFADTQYPYKDKQLEFSNKLLYDGKGADELWLPIVVKDGNQKHYISDGATAADISAEFMALVMESNATYQMGKFFLGVNDEMDPLELVAGSDTATEIDPTNKASVRAFYADYTGTAANLNDKRTIKHTPGTGEYVGLFHASVDSLADVQAVVDAYKSAGMPMKAISTVNESGDAWTDDNDPETGWKAYRYEVIKTLFGSPNSPLAQAGIASANYTDVMTMAGSGVVDIDLIEDVNDVEIEWKAKRGGNLVADVYIDDVDDLGGLYCVVFELTDHLGIAVQYIDGTLRMESGKNRELDEQDIRYNYYGKAAYSVTEYQFTVGDIENGYEVSGYDNYINLVDFNDEYHYVFFKKNVEWVEIEDNQGFYYEVDVAEQGKINLVYNNNAIPAVTDIASTDAVLAFYNFEARPIFDFAGKVTLTPPDEFFEEKSIEELYLYTYEKDGSLKPVKQAKVGEDGDTLEFRTNQLGKYVLSTEELTLLSDAERAALEALKEAEANGETVVEDAAVVVEENKANPGTGC